MANQEISHQLWLKSVLGKDLLDGEARELFMISRRERYKKGDKLFDEGDMPAGLWLLADGNVEIQKKMTNGTPTLLAALGPGAVAGEMSLLTREKHAASANVTSDELTALRVAWKDFEELLAQNPAVAYKLMYSLARVLAHRLRGINARLTEMAERNLNNAPHEQIEEFQSFKKKLFNDWSF